MQRASVVRRQISVAWWSITLCLFCLQILSTFGDLALQLGDSYEKYLETVKRMLNQAMHLSVMQAQTATDDDFLDYNNELRIGILEAYSGIFQGLSAGGYLGLSPQILQQSAICQRQPESVSA